MYMLSFFLNLTNSKSRSEKFDARGPCLPLVKSSSAEVRNRKWILYGNSAYLWRTANERYAFEKFKFTHSCASGNLLSRSVDHEKLLRPSWVGSRTILCKHYLRSPRDRQNNDEETPGECTVIAPRKKIPLQRHQSARYFLLPREIGMKITAGMCQILLY